MEVRPAEAIALPVPRPVAVAQDLVWPLLVALATAAAIAPFWASELLPYQDAPSTSRPFACWRTITRPDSSRPTLRTSLAAQIPLNFANRRSRAIP